LSKFMYELPKNRMVTKCPVYGLGDDTQKGEATFVALREYVSV